MGVPKIKIGWFSVSGLLALITLVSFLLGSSLYLAYPNLPFGLWHFLAEPPNKAIKILSSDGNDVYVQSVDSNIYACTHGNKCEQVDTVQERVVDWPCRFPTPDSIAPIPPGIVVDSLKYRSCGIDGYVDVYLVVLSDGTIWEYGRGSASLRSEFEILTYGLSGALISMLLGFIFLPDKIRVLTKFSAQQSVRLTPGSLHSSQTLPFEEHTGRAANR